jgi:hypothetical protein
VRIGSGQSEFAFATSTFEGAFAGGGVKGALVEIAGKDIAIYLPTGPPSYAYIQNALHAIDEGASKFNANEHGTHRVERVQRLQHLDGETWHYDRTHGDEGTLAESLRTAR